MVRWAHRWTRNRINSANIQLGRNGKIEWAYAVGVSRVLESSAMHDQAAQRHSPSSPRAGCSNANNLGNMDGGREAEISTYHNASGEHLSSMVLGGNATDIGKALAPLKDGGYVMGGVSLSTGS